jgi:hypothetical protein
MSKKLTPLQAEALERLTREWQSAYGLRSRLDTLDALVRRGLAERSYEIGSIAFPHTSTKYRRAAAAQ